LTDGSRKITYITEVAGMQGDVITLQDIFLFKQEGLDKNRRVMGRYVPTGFVPKFVEEMEAKGMRISRDLFRGDGGAPAKPAAGSGQPGSASGGQAAGGAAGARPKA